MQAHIAIVRYVTYCTYVLKKLPGLEQAAKSNAATIRRVSFKAVSNVWFKLKCLMK
jgi:hypothetical protein